MPLSLTLNIPAPKNFALSVSNINTTLLDRALLPIKVRAIYMPRGRIGNRVMPLEKLKKELAKEEHDR